MDYGFAEQVDILGSQYKIIIGEDSNRELDRKKKTGTKIKMGGCCFPKKEIRIRDWSKKKDTEGPYSVVGVASNCDSEEKDSKDIQEDCWLWMARKSLRHEIVHAFLKESGLMNNALLCGSWAMNEEIVDWISMQGEKIYKAWEEAGALEKAESDEKNEKSANELPKRTKEMAIFRHGVFVREVTDEEKKLGIVMLKDGEEILEKSTTTKLYKAPFSNTSVTDSKE